MSHEITRRADGSYEVMTAKTDAWHKLGVKLENCFSSADIAANPLLNWQVAKRELWAMDEYGMLTPRGKDGVFEIYRMDNGRHLGTVGAQYEPLQWSDMFAPADLMVGNGGAVYESAGSLFGGKVVFASLSLADVQHFEMGNGDQYVPYLNLVNSHDGTMAARWFLSVVRIVCFNTFQMSISKLANTTGPKNGLGMRANGNATVVAGVNTGANGNVENGNFNKHSQFAKVKHSKLAKSRIAEFCETMKGSVARNVNSLKELLTSFNLAMVTDDAMDAFFETLYPAKVELAEGKNSRNSHIRADKLADIKALYKYNDNGTFKDEKGTMLNLLNAVIEYTDHSARVISPRANSHTQDRAVLRAESAVLGNGAKLKEVAYNTAIAMSPLLPQRTPQVYSMPSLPVQPARYTMPSVVTVPVVLEEVEPVNTVTLKDMLEVNPDAMVLEKAMTSITPIEFLNSAVVRNTPLLDSILNNLV